MFDYTNVTLNTANALTIGGWCVTPGGIKDYAYRVIDAEGTVSELKHLADPLSVDASGAITAQGTAVGFDADCGIGSKFQNVNVINLSGYEGKTVTVQIVAVNNADANLVIAVLENVTVPAV